MTSLSDNLTSYIFCFHTFAIFFSCPPTSECKKTTFKNRLGVDQGDREVSFVCSSQCGVGCHLAESSIPGQSRACSLFQPLDLKNDGDPLTDDIFNTCPTLTMDTSTTPP